MSRTAINFLLDAYLFVTFVSLLGTSAILQFIFPPGTTSAGWTLWTLEYDTWHQIQTGGLIALALGVLLHLILHWTWVCGFIAARLSRLRGRPITTNEATRTIYGVATLALVLITLVVMLTLAQINLRRSTDGEGSSHLSIGASGDRP